MTDFSPIRDRLLALCNGNQQAVALIEGILHLAEVYDDLIDKDGRITNDDIHQAFNFMLFGLPANQVYREQPTIQVTIMNAMTTWRAANVMEKTGDTETLHASYVMRMSPYNVATHIVMCVAGQEAAIKAAMLLYSRGDKGAFASYLNEHARKE